MTTYGCHFFTRAKKQLCFFILLAACLFTIAPVNANEIEQALLEKARITQHIEQQQEQLNQYGDISNASIIQQIGSNNSATTAQSQSANFQTRNFAFIYQYGNQNNADIFQQGSGHSAVIWQEGNGHKATINQLNDNRAFAADIRQFGSSSDVQISQSGSDPRSISVEHHAYSRNAQPVFVEKH